SLLARKFEKRLERRQLTSGGCVGKALRPAQRQLAAQVPGAEQGDAIPVLQLSRVDQPARRRHIGADRVRRTAQVLGEVCMPGFEKLRLGHAATSPSGTSSAINASRTSMPAGVTQSRSPSRRTSPMLASLRSAAVSMIASSEKENRRARADLSTPSARRSPIIRASAACSGAGSERSSEMPCPATSIAESQFSGFL